jgi:hypothetical protein
VTGLQGNGLFVQVLDGLPLNRVVGFIAPIFWCR